MIAKLIMEEEEKRHQVFLEEVKSGVDGLKEIMAENPEEWEDPSYFNGYSKDGYIDVSY